jgi:hypothetical protein
LEANKRFAFAWICAGERVSDPEEEEELEEDLDFFRLEDCKGEAGGCLAPDFAVYFLL